MYWKVFRDDTINMLITNSGMLGILQILFQRFEFMLATVKVNLDVGM